MSKSTKRPIIEDTINEITSLYHAAIEAAQSFREKTKPTQTKDEHIGVIVANTVRKEEIEERVIELRQRALARISVIINEFVEGVKAFQTINGVDITPDSQILNDVFSPNQDDVYRLMEKYYDTNYSMAFAIQKYAKGKGYRCRHYQTAEQQRAIIDDFIKIMEPRFFEQLSEDTGTKMDFDVCVTYYKQRALDRAV